MHAPAFLTELLLLIGFAAIGVAVFDRLRLPPIVGFLLIGVLVGPGALGLVRDPARVRELAELGVIFLLFEIGLELPTERLKAMWRFAFVAGAFQVLLTLAAVAAIAAALGLDARNGLVMGALVAMSSTALVIRLLVERGEVDAPHGQLAVGILLFQDLCVVPFLVAVPLLAGHAGSTLVDVGGALLRSVAVLLIFFVFARFALPAALDRVMRLGSRELFTLLALLAVVGSAVVAEEIGLTLAVGAFIGGLVTGSSPYAHQLFAEVVPLRGVFLGLFFTAVGMLLDPGVALREARGVVGFVAGVLLLKPAVVVAVVVLLLRGGLRLGVQTGFALAQTGEFSFVLAGVAAAAGLLDARTQQIFLAGSVITLIATPFLVRAAPRLAALAARGADRDVATAPGAEGPARAGGHALLVGFGVAGRSVARVLRALGVPYLVLEANGRAVGDARRAREPVVFGDATRRPLLESVGIQRARLVVVAISDPIAAREVVALARRLAPDIRILARTHYVRAVDELAEAGADVVVSEEYEATIDLVSQTLRVLGTPEGGIQRFARELREEGYEPLRERAGLPLDPWLAELLQEVTTEWVDVPEGFAGEPSLLELQIRSRTGANVLGIERDGVLDPNPSPTARFRAGDRLLVLAAPEALSRLRALLS